MKMKYIICINDETLFSGQTDADGMGLEKDCIDHDTKKLDDYIFEHDLEVEWNDDFRYWNGGGGYQNGRRGVVAHNEEWNDEHADKLREILDETVQDAVDAYNETYCKAILAAKK